MSDLPMSVGEVVLTLMSAIFATVMWARWYLVPAALDRLGAPKAGWTALHVAPGVCMVLLFIVLRTAASRDVRDDIRHLEMEPIHIEPPSMFRRAWYRLIVLAGLRRANVGGFGAQIPEQSSGGSGFA